MPLHLLSHSNVARSCLAGAALATVVMVLAPPMGAWANAGTSMLSLHLLMELMAVVIAVLIVTVSWHTFNRSEGDGSSVLIAGFLVVAVCDVVHALTYDGMPSFFGVSSTERAIYFWLMGRSAEVLTLALLALGWAPRLSRRASLGLGVGCAVLLVYGGSGRLAWFPTTFVAGQGVTSFKAGYEVVLCAANLMVAGLLWRRAGRGDRQDSGRHHLLATSAYMIGIGELAFTTYVTPSDLLNVFGHVYKLAAYALLYVATYISSLRAPYEALAAAERRARESEQQVRSLSDNLPNCVVYQVVRENDGTMRFTHISEAVERVCGVRAEDVLRDARLVYERMHPDDAPALRAAEAASAQDMGVFEAMVRMRRGDDDWRWMQLLSAPRRLEDGRICWDGVQLDVTDSRRAEDQRRSLETQLRESQKMESIGTLAGGIAHDFNNILGAMLGHVAMAREDLGKGATQEAMQNLALVQRSCLRARDLVQQILTFSRKQPQDFVSQPVRPLVDEALALLRATLPARVSVQARLSDVPMLVQADATQIEQVLMNLCTNAWQALGGRPGHVDIGLERVAITAERAQQLGGLQPGDHVHLWVRDDGCGMDEATRQRVFEPFFTTKALGEGTGLGLSVVHGIVQAHHGAIHVDSAPGRGSTFHVYLPEAAPGPVAARLPTGTAVLQAGCGQRVLYLDDDEVMRLMVARLLERAGFDAQLYDDPDTAMAALRADPMRFDIVISDYNMPQRSGLDVAEEVFSVRPGMPMIITSGSLSDELISGARRLGIVALLEKQNTVDELVGMIHRALERAATGVR